MVSVKAEQAQATWLFEVVFDYDEGHYETVDPDPSLPSAEQHRFARASVTPAHPWAARPDPFSSHRAGFEVRTYRRCRRVLMFHHIPDLPTGEDGYEGLVRSTEFDYADLDYSRPVSVDDELAHQGSTRIAFRVRVVGERELRSETGATRAGGDGYRHRSGAGDRVRGELFAYAANGTSAFGQGDGRGVRGGNSPGPVGRQPPAPRPAQAPPWSPAMLPGLSETARSHRNWFLPWCA
ncbi:SpvB/TcaC N-terminal domain-containing protein [Streptomyces stelliscabiei]